MKPRQTKTKPKAKPRRRKTRKKSKTKGKETLRKLYVSVARLNCKLLYEGGERGRGVASVIHIARANQVQVQQQRQRRRQRRSQRKQTSRSYSVRITINAHRFILISRPTPHASPCSCCLPLSFYPPPPRPCYSLYSAAFSDMKLCLWSARTAACLPARCHLNCTSTIHKLQLPQLRQNTL